VGRPPEIESDCPLPRAAREFEKLADDCCPMPPTTPGCKVTNCSQSRPLRGSSRTAASPTSQPMEALLDSNCGAVASTSTLCWTSPTARSKFTVVDAPTVTPIPLRTEVLKFAPPASTS
jgi:hypothetical protein